MAESKITREQVAVKSLKKSDTAGDGSETVEEIMKRVLFIYF